MNGTTEIQDELCTESEVKANGENLKAAENGKDLPIEELSKEGKIFWAKIRGYSYWPVIVTVDPMEGETVQINEQYGTPQKKGIPRSRCKIHVHFLGYDNMRAWVTDDNVMPFEGKSVYDELAKKCPKNKEKDYYPTKKYQRLFEKGVKVAEEIEKLGLYARLKKLGLIYVPVPEKDDDSLGGSDSKKNDAANHPVIPKIPSGGGFFKSYTPVFIPKPEGPNKTSLDIFDFDENELDSLPIEFRKNEDQKPTAAASASTPTTTKNSAAAKNEAKSGTPKSTSTKAKNATKATTKQTPKSATKRKTPAKEPAQDESESAKATPKSSKQTPKSAMKRKTPAKDSADVESEKPTPKRAKKTPAKTPSKTTPKSTPKSTTKKQETSIDPSPKAKAPVKKTPGRKPKAKLENGTKASTTTPTLKVETASEKNEVLMKDLTAVTNAVRSDEFGESDDETGGKGAKFLLGSLVWGRMPGFPYWPCFITKSPSGIWKKTIGRRQEYHAQFFNWNNESGWISNALPWCSVEEYHKEAKFACPKGPNTPNGRNWYPPSRLAARWKGAVFEAQKTVKMSRKVRYSTFVAHYASEDATDSEEVNAKPANSTPDVKKDGRKSINRRSGAVATTPQSSKKQPQLAVNKKKVNKLGPASKTGKPKFEGVVPNYDIDEFDEKPCPASKKRVLVNGLPMAKIEVPEGWTYELSKDKKLSLVSPERITYDGVANAVGHLMQQNVGPSNSRKRSYSTSSIVQPGNFEDEDRPSEFGWFLRCTDRMHFETTEYSVETVGQLEGSVSYLKDDSLPPSWSVKTIRSKSLDESVVNISYQSSVTSEKKMKFTNKVSVAQFLEGMGHPALEIEQLLHNFPTLSKVLPKDRSRYEDDDISEVFYTINLAATSKEEVEKIPILSKCVKQSCYVDIVKIPELFLKHRHVTMIEKDNEMTMYDTITKEFIARKIIYD